MRGDNMAAVESKIKRYLNIDVLTAAKERIRHIHDTFDKVIVCFSGGKDSLVTLELTDEVRKEMGIKQKLTVIFRDEELIPDDVIKFVQKYYHSGRFDFKYYAVPLKSSKFILGKAYDYIQWDPDRRWIRPKPEFAITSIAGYENVVLSQYNMDAAMTQEYKGKIAVLTGIRADESIIRLRSCINKKNENYINATDAANVKLCKPIYDWSENDVFKFFYDREIPYCVIYDLQIINGQNLRVATPLLAESAKRFDKVKTLYPTFYEQIVDLFPEMIVQEKYWGDLDRYSIMYQYEHSWDGILKFIREQMEDLNQQKIAITRVLECKTMRENNMARGQVHNYGGYPILHVFKAIVAGHHKRVIQATKTPTKAELEYERG